MATVYVVQQPPTAADRPVFDFTPARDFGELRILAPNGKHILTPDVFRMMLEDGLADFNADEDYLITTGDYTVLFFVGMILGRRCGKVRVLRWVPAMCEYQTLVLDVNSIIRRHHAEDETVG